jgi:hypothetical protein
VHCKRFANHTFDIIGRVVSRMLTLSIAIVTIEDKGSSFLHPARHVCGCAAFLLVLAGTYSPSRRRSPAPFPTAAIPPATDAMSGIAAKSHVVIPKKNNSPKGSGVARNLDNAALKGPAAAPFGGGRSIRSLVVRQRSGMEDWARRRDMDECRLPVGAGYGNSRQRSCGKG